MEEGSLPTEKIEEVPKEESPTYKNARLWVQIDGATHELRQSINELKEWATSKLKTKMPERGPDPDCDPSDQILRDLHKSIINLSRPSNHNGDEDNIRSWHLIIIIVGMTLMIMATTYLLSWRIETLETKIDQALDHMKIQDERINRVEQQQYEERRRAPSP